MKRGIFVLILLLSINFVSAYGVSITNLDESGGSGSFDIKINSPEDIAGYQFYLEDNLYMTSMSGELTEYYGWEIASISPSGTDAGHFLMAATFYPYEDYIPAGSNLVTHITFDSWDGENICIVEGVDLNGDDIPDNNVVSDTDGRAIMGVSYTGYGDCGDDCGAPLGDLNADTYWNVLDIVTLANCVLASNCDADCIDENGEGNVCFGCAGNMNGDDGWNILDIVNLANCVLAMDCSG